MPVPRRTIPSARLRLAAALLLAVSPASQCPGDAEGGSGAAAGSGGDDYRCTLEAESSSTTVEVETTFASVSATAASGFAQLRRPGTDELSYAGHLAYRVAVGAGLSAYVGAAWANRLGLGAGAGADVGARVGFYYESPKRRVIEEVLRHKVPPEGWTRLSVELDAGVGGSARVGQDTLAGLSVRAGARTAAELTRHADTGYTVTRSWSGLVEGRGSGVVAHRIGLRRPSGKVSLSYALRFDGDGRPLRFTVVAEAPAESGRVRQVTRILDLDEEAHTDTVRQALPAIMTDPLAFARRSPGFFLTRRADRLVGLMERSGTLVDAQYEVDEQDIAYGVRLATFGGSFEQGTVRSVLRRIEITAPGGTAQVGCAGRPAAPRLKQGPPPRLPARCVPDAPPSPESSAAPPTPSVGPVAAPAPGGPYPVVGMAVPTEPTDPVVPTDPAVTPPPGGTETPTDGPATPSVTVTAPGCPPASPPPVPPSSSPEPSVTVPVTPTPVPPSPSPTPEGTDGGGEGAGQSPGPT